MAFQAKNPGKYIIGFDIEQINIEIINDCEKLVNYQGIARSIDQELQKEYTFCHKVGCTFKKQDSKK